MPYEPVLLARIHKPHPERLERYRADGGYAATERLVRDKKPEEVTEFDPESRKTSDWLGPEASRAALPSRLMTRFVAALEPMKRSVAGPALPRLIWPLPGAGLPREVFEPAFSLAMEVNSSVPALTVVAPV